MTTPAEKLAESLEFLESLQKQGRVVVKSRDLRRVHRERLVKHGFLEEVIKGWYIPAQPNELKGESTAWYASYWNFCSAYLNHRFGNKWCLSPEQSIRIQVGNLMVPQQLLVRSPKAQNNVTNLPHGTSLMEIKHEIPDPKDIEEKNGLKIFTLPGALVASAPNFFNQNPLDIRAALAMTRDASQILEPLLEGGHSIIAGRLAGAYRNIGRHRIADEIIQTMRTLDYDVREKDPFSSKLELLSNTRGVSPYVHRIVLMWETMRKLILKNFPKATPRRITIKEYLKRVETTYIMDAYHSLSIEGYQVNRQLIERVRRGKWNPDINEEDREYRSALAARGYYQAFQVVKKSVQRVLKGQNPGKVADKEHGVWYREMFAPSVTAGLLKPTDLAGYRNTPVYIRRSKHVPPKPETVRDLMPEFFELLLKEEEPSVRVVLGHFIFVYIHPYPDGNGRMGRFLMNVMLAAGSYPWTVIPMELRATYMSSLEAASVEGNIVPFTKFLGGLVNKVLSKKPAAKLPN